MTIAGTSLFFVMFTTYGLVALILQVIWMAGVSWQAIAFCVGLYYLRMFAITGAYHRYFSHRS